MRNKELSDVGKSSIDTVWLGNPHVVFFAGGVMQIQTVYDVSSGRGVAKRFGITVFLNGRAGIGDTVTAALRQAINLPPAVELHRFPGRSVVDHAVPIRFQVTNGLTETVRVIVAEGDCPVQAAPGPRRSGGGPMGPPKRPDASTYASRCAASTAA